MKRPLAMLLCLVLMLSLYAACSMNGEKTADAAPSITFTRDNMPRLDGSTSTVPLALAVCAEVLGESREEVQDLVHFNKTTTAYFNLLEGNADMLIVGEANDDVMARKKELNFEWEKQPFATDAFVFVVNEDNPVDSITVEQARDIYSGKITNWKELGGEDRPITALQRNEGAGSQTLMEKLVMQGTPMMEAPTEYIVTTMGQLMEAVKSFDGSPGAIGYSVYYYAEEMKMAQGLKLLKLDGVAVTDVVYSNVFYPSYYEDHAQHPMPLLALVQGQQSNRIDGFEERYTVAAADGSWVMEESYRALSASRHGLLLFGDDALTVTDTFGKVTQILSYQEIGISDEDVENMISSLMWGGDPSGHRSGDRIEIGWVNDDTYQNIRYYDLSTGKTGEMAWDAFDALDGAPGEDYIEPTYAVENANRFDDEALGSDAPGLLSVYDADENGVVLRYYRDDGTPIESLTMHGEKWYRQVALRGGLIEVLDLNTAAYYDLETMNCVFETYLGYEAD